MKITYDRVRKGLDSNPKNNISVDKTTRKTLSSYSNYYKKAVKSGEDYVKKSSKRYGGNPLPWELGGESFFHKLKSS